MPAEIRSLIAAGTLMGIGLGGFIDGIVFHQILALHNMLSNRIPRTTVANVEINMFWDGLFHAFCFAAVGVALLMLWRVLAPRRAIPSGRVYIGSLWVGWGVFNLVEGVLDHEVLQLHHVYQADPERFLLWDMAFLASGLCFLLFGLGVIRTAPAFLLSQSTDLRYDEIR